MVERCTHNMLPLSKKRFFIKKQHIMKLQIIYTHRGKLDKYCTVVWDIFKGFNTFTDPYIRTMKGSRTTQSANISPANPPVCQSQANI